MHKGSFWVPCAPAAKKKVQVISPTACLQCSLVPFSTTRSPRRTSWNLRGTLVEPSWNLTSRPPRTTPEPIWAETPKLSAVGEKSKHWNHGWPESFVESEGCSACVQMLCASCAAQALCASVPCKLGTSLYEPDLTLSTFCACVDPDLRTILRVILS